MIVVVRRLWHGRVFGHASDVLLCYLETLFINLHFVMEDLYCLFVTLNLVDIC